MTNISTPSLFHGINAAEDRELLAIWVCWLNRHPALVNYHAVRLCHLIGAQEGKRWRKALLNRRWEGTFTPPTRAKLHYAELLACQPKQLTAEHRNRLLKCGMDPTEIQLLHQAVAYYQYTCISPKGFGARARQRKTSTVRRRNRRYQALSQTAYRPIMRTMHNRFQGLGADTASPWFDLFFRISGGMAAGCGLAMWVLHGDRLTYILGSQLPNHGLINGIALGSLLSLAVNPIYYLWRSARVNYNTRTGRPLPPTPTYVGRPALVITFILTLLLKVG